VVAEELRRRFGLPQWRFTNSGTELTMDAVHLARVATGRPLILKIEGSYHGHHDAVMVSVRPPLEALGDREVPSSVPFGGGHPRAVTDLTRAIPFNDADLLERVLDDIGEHVAALILEPAMMNITIVAPRPGYLERARELTAAHGVVLIFDEVKTGCTIGAGGATARFGVRPDIVCLAKAMCGGYPCGAIGMTEKLAALSVGRHAPGRHHQRQPARDGGGRSDAARGAHGGGVRTARGHERAHALRSRRRDRAVSPAVPHRRPGCQGLRGVLARAPARVPRLRDARRRGAVDARGCTT
jgi:glutamate-1-semialdehyde 2,1-aminomutase